MTPDEKKESQKYIIIFRGIFSPVADQIKHFSKWFFRSVIESSHFFVLEKGQQKCVSSFILIQDEEERLTVIGPRHTRHFDAQYCDKKILQ